MRNPKISVVTYCGEHPVLSEALEALATQEAAPEEYEVVVVDYDPNTVWPSRAAEFASRHPGLALEYSQLKNGSRASALNAGVRQARAPIIVFLADDYIPLPNFVTAHLQFHQGNPSEEAVGVGPVFFPEHLLDCDFRRWLEDSGTLFGVSFTTGGPNFPKDFFYVANTSLKKSFFLDVGGLNEDFPYAAWDDYELGLRLKADGMSAQLVPGAKAWHEHAVTLVERGEAMRDAGESAVIFERKYSGAQPWHSLCAQSPWKNRAKGEYWRLKHHFTHSSVDRASYYRKILDAHFVAAYRKAKNIKKPSGANSTKNA